MRGTWPFAWFHKTSAQWFVRLRAHPVTPRLDAKFRRWLATDPANEVEYERHELAWELAGELAKDEEIEALLAEAQQAAAAEVRPRPRQHILMWSAATAALIVAIIGITLNLQLPGSAQLYVTAVGEQRTIVLPDQSRMELNTDTEVRVVYRSSTRSIEIKRGEATFSVMHDAQRPFEVQASHGTTRALGTEFNVLVQPAATTVAVLSGKVEVIPDVDGGAAPQSITLVHGTQVTRSNVGFSPVAPADLNRIVAWHSGRVAFADVDLKQALVEFNRYTATPIELGDSSLARLRVSGTFRIGETNALLQALEQAFGIRAERQGDAIELRPRDAG
jgi:transmembrane sensor